MSVKRTVTLLLLVIAMAVLMAAPAAADPVNGGRWMSVWTDQHHLFSLQDSHRLFSNPVGGGRWLSYVRGNLRLF